MNNEKYDLIIVGGGPAGCAAAVYAARKQLKTLLILKEWGGQSIVSDDIQNWIGTPHISGSLLAENLKKHVEEYKGDYVQIKDKVFVKSVKKSDDIFTIECDDDSIFSSDSILVSSGSIRRKLQVPNADKFEHKGITYCASCDGPVFSGQDVVVIGGGNAAFESAAQLLAYCKSVTLINRSDSFKADEVTVEKLSNTDGMTIIKNAEPKEVNGDIFVESFTYTNTETGEDVTLNASGIFVEIGQVPATSFVSDAVELDKFGHIVVDPKNQRSTNLGIWAAGDCTNGLYHQNNIAAGDAVKAIEDIYIYLKTK